MDKISIAAIVIQILLLPIEVMYSFNFSHPTLVSLEFRNIECIKPDVYRSGVLLVCAHNAVMEFNIQTGNFSLIAGQYGFDRQFYAEGEGSKARFKYVTDIVQKDRESLIVIDSFHSCLRLINSSRTSLLAGNCTNHGFQDGDFNSARFYSTWGLLMHSDNILYVSDTLPYYYYASDSKIRIVNLGNRMVSTLQSGISIRLPRQRMVCLYPQCNDIYIAFQNGVMVYNGTTNTTELIAGGTFNERGNSTGSLRETRFFVPSDLAFLSQDALFVVDRLNFRIVLLNLNDFNRSSHVAIGEIDSTIHRSAGGFLPIEPQGMLCYNGSLYIGTTNDGLYKSEVTDIPDDFICFTPEQVEGTVTTFTTTHKTTVTNTTTPVTTFTISSTRVSTTTTEAAKTTLLSSTPSTTPTTSPTPTTFTIPMAETTISAKSVSTAPQIMLMFSQSWIPTSAACLLRTQYGALLVTILFSLIFCW